MFRAGIVLLSVASLVLSPSLTLAREADDIRKELLEDVVKVKGAKMSWEEFGLLTLHRQKGRRLQVAWRVEAPARGVISRDQMVALGTALQTVVLFGLASDGKRLDIAKLSELYSYTDLDALIGKADLEITVVMAKDGLQLSLSGAETRRATMTWEELLGDDASSPPPTASETSELPPTCRKFLTTYEQCVMQMPEAARRPALEGLAQMREAWSKAQKDDLEVACQQGWDAAKGGMGAACPDVKWR